MKFLAYSLFFLFLTCRINAQAPIAFERYYDFGATEEGYCVQQTADHGYIIAGRQTLGVGFEKMLLQKTDSIGQTQWSKLIGSPYESQANSVRKTFDHGYIITGFTTDVNYTQYVYLVKTDSIGDTLWTKRNISPITPQPFGGSGNGYGYDVIQTSDSGFVVVANITDFDTVRIAILIKTNANGDTLWTKKMRRLYGGLATSIKQTTDSGFIISGAVLMNNSQSPPWGVYLIKTDAVGDTLWTRILTPSSANPCEYSVCQTSDGGYFLAGQIYNFNNSSDDIYILKTDALGDTLWTKKIGGTGYEWGTSAQQTLDGGYIITGTTSSYGAGGEDVYLVKTNNSGNVTWSKTFGGVNNDVGDCVEQTSDHGYIISGFTASFGIQSGDIYLIKTDSLGNAPTSINEINSEKNLISVFPNPISASAKILVNDNNNSEHTFSLYDFSGREIRNEKFSGSSFVLNRNDLSAGIYFCVVRNAGGNFIGKAKIVVE